MSDGRLDRKSDIARDGEIFKLNEVGIGRAGDEVALGNSVDLSAVGRRPQDGKLIGGDVDIMAVYAQQWLIAEARTTRVNGGVIGAVIGSIEVVNGPGSGGVTGSVDGDVRAGLGIVGADEENRGKPGIGGGIEEPSRR